MTNTPKERKLIDYTQRGKQLPDNPSYPKNERPRMRGGETQLWQSSISSFDRNSKFNLASGKLFQGTLELLRNIDVNKDDEEMVEFYLKIPSQKDRGRRGIDLKKKALPERAPQGTQPRSSSIFELVLSNTPLMKLQEACEIDRPSDRLPIYR